MKKYVLVFKGNVDADAADALTYRFNEFIRGDYMTMVLSGGEGASIVELDA